MESKLTKYFRKQFEGTEQNVEINSLIDSFIKSKGGTINQNELVTHLKSFGFTAGQIIDHLDKRFGKALDPFKGRELRVSNLLGKSWFELPQSVRDKIPNKRFDWDIANDTQRQNILAQAGKGSGTDDSGEARLSPLDKFENGFNTPNRCVDCGLGRKAHEKGGIGHPFRTRKQARSNTIEAKEVKDEIEFWNTATSGQKRRIAVMLDINQNAKWEQLTPAEQGSLAVWWDEGGGSKSIGGSEGQIMNWMENQARIQNGGQWWSDLPRLTAKKFGITTQRADDIWDSDGAEEIRVPTEDEEDRLLQQFLRQKPNADRDDAIDFLMDHGVGEMDALITAKDHFGANKKKFKGFGESFYNYDGAETLDSRAEEQSDDEVRSWWEQLAPQRRTGVIDGSSMLRFNELGPSAKQAVKLAFLRKPIPDALMMKAINGEIKKPIGALSKKKISRLRSKMTPEEREDADESFYQYESIPANEGLVNIETTGELFHNVLGQLSALAPIQNFEIKAQFTDGKKGLIVLSFEKAKDQKMMVDILKGVMKTNGVTKVGSTEVFAGEGQKFTVTQDGTMLPKGNYEVLGKKIDSAHSGPWGTFSNTTVKNLDTGEKIEIPTGNAQLIYGIEKKKAFEKIDQQRWDKANHSTRRMWLHKHVQGLFVVFEDEFASKNWRQLTPEIRKDLMEQELVADEFMDHGLRRQIERQIEDGSVTTQEQVRNIIKGSLGRAGVPEEEFEDMFTHFKVEFPNLN